MTNQYWDLIEGHPRPRSRAVPTLRHGWLDCLARARIHERDGPELPLLLRMSGLCHDLGHLLFSDP
jgi:hypothetical protein